MQGVVKRPHYNVHSLPAVGGLHESLLQQPDVQSSIILKKEKKLEMRKIEVTLNSKEKRLEQ